MIARSLILAAAAAAAFGGLAAPASAATDPAKPASACFFSRNWKAGARRTKRRSIFA